MDIILVTNKNVRCMGDHVEGIKNSVSEKDRVLFTGLDKSASHNRNFGLSRVQSNIFVMMDDDVSGFYEGWLEDLIKPMLQHTNIMATSARLINEDGSVGSMMGNNRNYSQGFHDAIPSSYKGYWRLPTACIAVRTNGLRFNEDFVGSGYEDTDYFNKLSISYPDCRVVINNNCKLIHRNEQKNQGGKYWEQNKKTYLSLYPDDTTVQNQKDWTK